MKFTTVLVAVLAMAACSKKSEHKSKPVTCDVAGQMLAKRLREFSEGKVLTDAQRTQLDKDLTTAISARCTEDKWDELPLGCLGAVHSIPDGKLSDKNYRGAVDTCTKAIGDDKWKKMEDAVSVVVRSLRK